MLDVSTSSDRTDSMAHANSERELIETFLTGDSPGFSQIRRWIDFTLRRCNWGHRVDNDDVCQESWTALVKNFRGGGYRGDGIQALLWKITISKYIDAFRVSYNGRFQSL